MKKSEPKVLWLLVFTLVACSPGQKKNLPAYTSQKNKQQDTSRYADLFPSVIEDLNKKHFTGKGSYYMLTQFSDSTVKLVWGNDAIKRVCDDPFDFMFAERLSVKWENKNYLILDYYTGSNAWINVALPLKKQEQVQEFRNGLCFDEKNNYLVTEEVGDTVLSVHNLKTRQEQFIIEKQRPCESGMNYGCIDSISIHDGVLYYKWVTPRMDIKPNRKVERREQLKI